jgi:hypothetical protein
MLTTRPAKPFRLVGVSERNAYLVLPSGGRVVHIDARNMLSYEHYIKFMCIASSWFFALPSYIITSICSIQLASYTKSGIIIHYKHG